MTDTNLEIVRRSWARWDERDMPGLFALYDPAIVLHSHDAGPIETVLHHGHQILRRGR